jgi:hypothetical protein
MPRSAFVSIVPVFFYSAFRIPNSAFENLPAIVKRCQILDSDKNSPFYLRQARASAILEFKQD